MTGIFTGLAALHAENTYIAELYNSTSGLSNNWINVVYTDSRGYLWIGTDDGLNRFDGYEYVVFRPEIYNNFSIAAGKVNDIVEDGNGILWVANERGLNSYNRETNSFDKLSFPKDNPGHYSNEIQHLAYNGDSILWCLGNDFLFRVNVNTAEYVEFNQGNILFKGFDPGGILFYDWFHDLLLLGGQDGLFSFDVQEERFIPVSVHKHAVREIYQDGSGTLWLGTENGLLSCNWPLDQKVPLECKYILNHQSIVGIQRLDDDKLLIAERSRLLLYDMLKQRIISEDYITLKGEQQFTSIGLIYLDNMKNLWIGTNRGLAQTNLTKKVFRYYSDSTNPVYLNRSMIFSILKDGPDLLLGSRRGGLEIVHNIFNGQGEKRVPNTTFPDKDVYAIFKDSKERIWILSGVPYIFDRPGNRFEEASLALGLTDIDLLNGKRLFSMEELRPGYFALSYSRGVMLIDENQGQVEIINSLIIDSINYELYDVSGIAFDSNNLWIGSTTGLFRYDLQREKHSFYPIGAENGLFDRVLNMKLDSKGQLWLGTPSGLFLYDREKDFFTGFSVGAGFANDFIYAIEEDAYGRLWMSTNKGIISFDPGSHSIKNYGVQHGLSTMEFNLNASFQDQDGTLYFGSVNGVNVFHPDSIIHGLRVPCTSFTGLRSFRQDFQYYKPFVPDEYSVRDDEAIQLYFAILDYGNPVYKKFRYRILEPGTTKSWNEIGNENSIILSGLPHGKYIIEIQGSTIFGDWSKEPARLELSVTSPFFRRRFFLILMFIPVILLIFFLFEFRMKTLRKSNRALMEKEKAAKEVLKQKNLLSRRNKGIEDSLKYAQRIQYAMFTSEVEIKKMFSESFILQKPKDIVSGDFYWAKKIRNKVFIAAADCTGHGVPGAFMSLIGLEFFRQIIGVQGVHKPAHILNEINKNFDLIFEKEDDLEMRDGMDLALCAIDLETKVLEYAGAFNPLYIIRDGEIIEIKADKIMLGPDLGFGRKPFTNHVFDLKEKDMLYMFSDGYADQFGGPEGKKFKFRRFRHLLLSIYDQPMSFQHKILENSISDWQGENEQVDDILVMGFRPLQ